MTDGASTERGSNERIVLVAAPTRRDAEITCELLGKQGIEALGCGELREVAERLGAGVGAIVLTDAALSDPAMDSVLRAIAGQPPWSDVPILLLARDKVYTASANRWLEALSNVTLLDRPSSTRAMVSAVQAALRARQRQYQIRDQLVAQQRSDEALRQADKRKDEFLATLAHELRNPLAAIRTALEVVVRVPRGDERAERLIGMIDRQSRMLVKLIDELMDVSRIATGKVVLEKERLDLRGVVEVSVEGSQAAFDAARHAVAIELPEAPVWVTGDAARLAQVVSNLLHNAAKYTPEGGRIALTLVPVGAEAVMRVADDGVGIAPDLLEQVFEMFTQVDRTMERSRGGLGIGLSLVRRLVALHGGAVTAESGGIGRGSTFTVRLPLAVEAARPAPRAPDEAAAVPARLKVLVVDDNADVADGLAALVEIGGHEIRITHDGASALVEAATFAPDIVFCDIGMPDMSGHELARRLRSMPSQAGTRLVAVTGWGNEDDKRLSLEAGFDLHFTKPINAAQVASVLKSS